VTGEVTDARPPAAVVAVLNPINRVLLRGPIGHAIKPLALVEFTGRRSGRHLRVPVLWHPVGDGGYVFSPAPWRANFAGGTIATVTHLGRKQLMRGTLITSPSLVADALNGLLAAGTKPGRTGLAIPRDHELTPDDVSCVHRALIRFDRP
jgi:hypothetical protein